MPWPGCASARLGRPGVFAVLAVVLGFTVAANGALVRTTANMFDIVIPPMERQADWAAAKEHARAVARRCRHRADHE